MPTVTEKIIEISTLPSGNTVRDHLLSASSTAIVFDGPINIEVLEENIEITVVEEVLTMEVCNDTI